MLSVSVSNQTFLVAGAVCLHPVAEFPEMKRGWKAELAFGQGACIFALTNSNGRLIRNDVAELTPVLATSLLFEADEWRVLGTDGSPSLIPFPGVFDPLSLCLDVPVPAEVLTKSADAADADEKAIPDVYTKGYLDADANTKAAWWEFAILGEGSQLLARAQGTTSGECGNIGGELAAVMRAVQWAINNGHPVITLHYEHPGCEHWARGRWSANRPMTIAYAAFMQKAATRLAIRYRHLSTRKADAASSNQARAQRQASAAN